jgi:hypothetical protein
MADALLSCDVEGSLPTNAAVPLRPRLRAEADGGFAVDFVGSFP